MTKDEAMQQALEWYDSGNEHRDEFKEMILRIIEALAQPEQKPVAWMDEDGDVLSASVVSGKGLRNIPLYTSPPQRKWIELTYGDIWQAVNDCTFSGDLHADKFAQAIEAKLKEKNT